MIKLINKKSLLLLLVFFLSPFAYATPPEWQILPENSRITFIATQNDAPVLGQFKKFSGIIQFDLKQLAESKVRIVIDMNSVTTTYNDLTSTLISPDWFNVTLFPHAVFTADHFKKISDTQYEADGSLTIRDKTVPTTLKFTATELANQQGRVEGSVVIKRNAFGVGQGEWAQTNTVKDDVQVNFVVVAKKK